MQLEEFFDYKNQLMEDLLTNKEIVRLLDDNFTVIEEPQSLAYKQVHPYEYIPEVVDKGHTFICFDVDISKTMNKTFMQPVLYIWVFTHKSKMQTPNGGVRTDRLCSEIAKAINGSRYYGLGELEMYSVKRFCPTADYIGKVMMFQTQEFNRQSPTGKAIPSNRKGH